MIKLELCSAMDLLKTLDDKSIDLILTDPPYIISRRTGFESCVKGEERFKVNMDFGEWDTRENFTIESLGALLTEYYRVLKNGGTVIMFYDLWKIQELKELMESKKFKQIRLVEWIKTNPVPLNSKINYLSNAREVAVLAVKKGKPTFHSEYDKGIYNYPICHEKGRFHPTQKPEAFMKELIEKHSNEGDLVLDTFAGSGTTLAAAVSSKRSALGCEINGEFFYKALKRLNLS